MDAQINFPFPIMNKIESQMEMENANWRFLNIDIADFCITGMVFIWNRHQLFTLSIFQIKQNTLSKTFIADSLLFTTVTPGAPEAYRTVCVHDRRIKC